MNAKKKALGRGLNALLSDSDSISNPADSYISAIPNIPIEQIQTNPFQPRTDFEEVALQELSESIQSQGIIQPITVRKLEDNVFQLISGERRLRAAKLAGLLEIPAYVRTVEDNDMLELALVENIQRENLNAIEIAHSFQRLIEECNLTQELLSNKVGKKRTTIVNYMRLLKLPPAIQIAIRDNNLSMGHARAIINIADEHIQLKIFNDIIAKGLSVRQVEEIVRKHTEQTQNKKTGKKTIVSSHVQEWKKHIAEKTNAKVSVKMNESGKGSIVISFKNMVHLKDIIEKIQ